MSAIAAAVAAVFADPTVAVDGAFLPAAGGSVEVRVIWSRPDETEQVFGGGVVGTRRIAEIQASQVAAPARGDRLQVPVDGSIYPIAKDPRQPDDDRLIWRLELGAPV